MKNAMTKARWEPAKYQMGISRAKAPVDRIFKMSKKTHDTIDTVGDVLLGGLSATVVSMALAPQCIIRGGGVAPGSPELALLFTAIGGAAVWFLSGDTVGPIAGIGTGVLLYASCKLF